MSQNTMQEALPFRATEEADNYNRLFHDEHDQIAHDGGIARIFDSANIVGETASLSPLSAGLCGLVGQSRSFKKRLEATRAKRNCLASNGSEIFYKHRGPSGDYRGCSTARSQINYSEAESEVLDRSVR